MEAAIGFSRLLSLSLTEVYRFFAVSVPKSRGVCHSTLGLQQLAFNRFNFGKVLLSTLNARPQTHEPSPSARNHPGPPDGIATPVFRRLQSPTDVPNQGSSRQKIAVN